MLKDIQASSTTYDIMGNPDIKPEKTVQYQFGYRQALTEWFGLEANVFYKDIRDLLGVEFISTYNDAEYARWTNVDYGTVVGVDDLARSAPARPVLVRRSTTPGSAPTGTRATRARPRRAPRRARIRGRAASRSTGTSGTRST